MVVKEEIKLSEQARSMLGKIDFRDTFSTTNHINTIDEVVDLIFSMSPKWVEVLFKIRNFIAGFVGLKTAKPEKNNSDLSIGQKIKFFEIYAVSDQEIIMGANDSHLKFRAVISNYKTEEYNIKVTTLVEYNNTLGKVYMNIIKPFHVIVIKSMIKQAYKKG